MNPDGTAGKGVNLATSLDDLPTRRHAAVVRRQDADGGRPRQGRQRPPGRGEPQSGDKATIRVVKDHYMLPTAVTVVGSTAYVLEAKLNYQRDPALKGKDPAPFKAYAVPLK